MKAKILLSQIESIETVLNEYSFEELGVKDGILLKKSFESFKDCLEQMVFQPSNSAPGYSTLPTSSEKKTPKVTPKISNNATMLIANVSHEIRTPLNGIIGFADLLKEEALTKLQLEKVDAIQTASQSLMKIINELLEYSKLTEGLEQIEQTDFNFFNVIDNVVYLCRTLITSDDVVLVTNVDPRIPNVLKGNPAKLSQVLLNLIGNAVKFVEAGEINLEINLKSKKANEVVLEFTVADTGIGISEEHLTHIFDYFKQADKHTQIKYGGTGLGLSIVKKIIELSKGEISVTSELNKGTSFKFSLPYSVGDALKVNDNDFLLIDKKVPKELIKDKRILVFEDDPMNQRLYKQRLKFWGCKSYITDNGKAGLKFLREHPIDLILMDLRMPGMHGTEITQLIRKESDYRVKNTPIIVVSADISAHELNNCEAIGVNDFLLKPFSSEELMLKIIKNIKTEEPSTISTKEMPSNTVQALTRLDLNPLKNDCLGEVSFMKEIIQFFRQNAYEFIGVVKSHLKEKDFEKLDLACHKIKSGLAMLQANQLHKVVEEIQLLCKNEKDVRQIRMLYESFIEEYLEVEQLLDIELEEL